MIQRVIPSGLFCVAVSTAIVGLLSFVIEVGALQFRLNTQSWGWATVIRGQVVVTTVFLNLSPTAESADVQEPSWIEPISRKKWRDCIGATDIALHLESLAWYETNSTVDIVDVKPDTSLCPISQLRSPAPIWVRNAGIPAWLIVVVTGAYPCIVFLREWIRRRGRSRRGECLACGYDLRGNESGLCSECGNPVGSLDGSEPRHDRVCRPAALRDDRS